MSQEYEAPGEEKDAYHCPHCDTYSHKKTGGLMIHNHGHITEGSAHICGRCGQHVLWMNGSLVYPDNLSAPNPHEYMPGKVARDYVEAAKVLDDSPRAAAALLRLAIERLTNNHLGGGDGYLNQQIGNLVEDGQISSRVQRALDSVRVIGNNSVHPGEMDMDDNRETAEALFRLTNEIVDETIGREKRIDDVYESLPEGALDGIENRDGE